MWKGKSILALVVSLATAALALRPSRGNFGTISSQLVSTNIVTRSSLFESVSGYDIIQTELSPKVVTKQIMMFFDGSKNTYSDRENFRSYLLDEKVVPY